MKLRNLIVILSLSMMASVLVGCAGESARNSASNTASSEAPKAVSSGGGGGGGRSTESSNPAAAQLTIDQAEKSKPVSPAADRKIIRNAELTLEANVPEEIQQKIAALIESKGGFVVESQQVNSNAEVKTSDTVTMTVRVPAEKFEESLEAIRKTANRVVVETVKGQDVTDEFIDVEAQLKAKKALEEQFLEIMKQSKTVPDALNVQRELANVRAEIEKFEGKKRFLENQAALSTIKVRIETPSSASPSSAGFFYKLGQSISTGFDAALTFVLYFVTALIAVLPFLLLIVLPIYLLLRYFIRRTWKWRAAREVLREDAKAAASESEQTEQ